MSEPSLEEFNPKNIPWQFRTLKAIKKNFDYSEGPHEILLSGSVGSAKSLFMAHMVVTHCLEYSGARVLLGRRALPDLKDTILRKILDHLEGTLVEGKDYSHNEQKGFIKFHRNGSEIISRSWADKRYRKLRSLEISAAVIEELTENSNEECQGFHADLVGRVGRINSSNSAVKENWIIYATNPDDPAHWAYDYFIKGSKEHDNRHVVYSLTSDNPFLPPWYEKSLRKKYDSKMIQRMLEGKWIWIKTDVIYYEYNSDLHFKRPVKFNPDYPIRITYDFNIGEGKPLSSTAFQYDYKRGKFCFLDEVVIEGSRTRDSLDEWALKGIFDLPGNPKIIIHGDAAGRHKDTRSNQSDYEIIEKFLANYERKKKHPVTREPVYLNFDIDVPKANPSIRDRHNTVNGQLKNSYGTINVELSEKCVTLDEGFTKTKLKKGGSYIEDDSEYYQHITTAAGYGICSALDDEELEPITQR